MKKYTFLLLLLCSMFVKHSRAQNVFCDSIMVDSVYIDNNMLHLTVYNQSQHFIVYPFFNVQLNPNSYIALTDSTLVLSFLSVPGDANNGYSTANYQANIMAASLVPLNTLFTGTITITDPNDSTFSCTYPYSFLYGTMATSLNEKTNTIATIFPNPAVNLIHIKLQNFNKNNHYYIFDLIGNCIITGIVDKGDESIDISMLEDGVYTLRVGNMDAALHRFVKIKP